MVWAMLNVDASSTYIGLLPSVYTMNSEESALKLIFPVEFAAAGAVGGTQKDILLRPKES